MPLTDDEAYERLHAALLALGRDDGFTRRATTALETARRALSALQIALVFSIERDMHGMPGLVDSDD